MSQHDINDWNRIAPAYASPASGTDDDRIYAQFRDVLWHSLGDVRGRKVLDVGCGAGWLSRLLLDAGAEVVGVDGAAKLLELARQAAPTAMFMEHDLVAGLPPLDHQFDRVVAYMLLQDLPAIDVLLASIHDVLTPGGRFVFTIPHPCFFQMRSRRDEVTGQLFRMVTAYLAPEVWRIDSFGGHNHYHRSLTFYVDALRSVGFAVTRLYEPEHIPGPRTTPEDEAFWRGIPVFLLIEAVLMPDM